jgi:ribosomal protein S18 acetylase RimI-like enzyme
MQVVSGEDVELARALLLEYASSLNASLSYQNFESELSSLPGEYSPPKGALLIALENDQLAGCVALRRLTEDKCELKRLYVRPDLRRKGLGKSLVQSAIDQGREIGYVHLRLGTLSTMKEALSLYRSLGFREIKPYKVTPLRSAVFMELRLREPLSSPKL